MSSTTVSQALLESSVRGREPNALNRTRESALSRFLKSGLPTTRDEEWRYTNLKAAAEISNAIPPHSARDSQLLPRCADELRAPLQCEDRGSIRRVRAGLPERRARPASPADQPTLHQRWHHRPTCRSPPA